METHCFSIFYLLVRDFKPGPCVTKLNVFWKNLTLSRNGILDINIKKILCDRLRPALRSSTYNNILDNIYLFRGELVGCFGLTEPNHGSDPAHMETKVYKILYCSDIQWRGVRVFISPPPKKSSNIKKISFVIVNIR